MISAVLAKRGLKTILATDTDPRALACAQENFERLGITEQVQLQQADLFPKNRYKSRFNCLQPAVVARQSRRTD